jgi:diaminopimelate epimerase
MSGDLGFWKYQGLGNDFVIVAEALGGEAAKALCDRRLGIGADGLLEVTRPGPDGADAAIVVWNSDGSPAQICGNGLRCAALHLTEVEHVRSPMFLATGAGSRRCLVTAHPGRGEAEVAVEMGRGCLDRAMIPVAGAGTMIEEPLEVLGHVLRLTAVGMGNPHAVTFDPVSRDDVARIGPAIERDPRFPEGVNVGFARMVDPGSMVLVVWERGAGLTGACGSGACAAAVAACSTGRAHRGSTIFVEQPGGELAVTVGHDGDVVMAGRARRVFTGTIDRPTCLVSRP